MSKKERIQLTSAPRLYINLAILIGGAIGYLTQDYLNMGNEEAFLLTGLSCFITVIIVNYSWLFLNRRSR